MAKQRHATRIKNAQPPSLSAFLAPFRLLAPFKKLSRIQLAALGIATTLFTLGFTQTQAIVHTQKTASTINQAAQSDATSNRKVVTLELDLEPELEQAAPTTGRANITPASVANTPSAKAASALAANKLPTHKPPVNTVSEKIVAASFSAVSMQPVANHNGFIGPLPKTRAISRTIKSGDNLSELFSSVGLSQRDVYDITRNDAQGKALTRMFPGETLTFIFDHSDALHEIVRQKSALESVHFKPLDNGKYTSQVATRSPEIKRIHKSGIVNHSLSRAADKAGLSQSTIMNMANIFGGVMDFALDVRGGDTFTVIYEEHYLDGKKIKDGNIVAAQYINRGTAHNAYRYEHSDARVGYYNEEGISLRRAFLRAPLDFTRVSSNFNLRRLHPITKKVKPHRGIDYAARTGTPVFSVGEGRVIASGYSSANGKYVFVKHGEAYTTKYLHLHKRSVKRGQRVKQGQIIGQVGCTGLCTGPHLHYEFLWNGVHRNPRTIVNKLPKAKRLAKAELPAFSQSTASAQDVLHYHSNQFALALAQ
jgi:murein DD-endopeptidase MepM/ murein hydrolase activator NlpD